MFGPKKILVLKIFGHQKNLLANSKLLDPKKETKSTPWLLGKGQKKISRKFFFVKKKFWSKKLYDRKNFLVGCKIGIRHWPNEMGLGLMAN